MPKAKGKQELQEEEPQAAAETPEEVVPEEQPEEEPATQEEDWKAKHDELFKEFTRINEGYKGLQKTLNKKDAELKQFSDTHGRMDSLEDTLRVFGGLIGERFNLSDEEIAEKKVDFKKTFDEEITRQKATREQQRAEEMRKDYNRRADEAWARAEKVYANNPDKLDLIEGLLMSGRLDKVLTRLEGAGEASIPSKETKTVETEEQIFERIARQKGLLKSDSLKPGGKSRSSEQTLKEFAEGGEDWEGYAKIREKLPRTME